MNDFSVQQGWQCPICKRVYSPNTPMCWYCGGESITKTSTDGIIDWVKHEGTTGTITLDMGGYTVTYPVKGTEE